MILLLKRLLPIVYYNENIFSFNFSSHKTIQFKTIFQSDKNFIKSKNLWWCRKNPGRWGCKEQPSRCQVLKIDRIVYTSHIKSDRKPFCPTSLGTIMVKYKIDHGKNDYYYLCILSVFGDIFQKAHIIIKIINPLLCSGSK